MLIPGPCLLSLLNVEEPGNVSAMSLWGMVAKGTSVTTNSKEVEMDGVIVSFYRDYKLGKLFLAVFQGSFVRLVFSFSPAFLEAKG